MGIKLRIFGLLFSLACTSCAAPDPYTNSDSLEFRAADSSPAFVGCLESFDTGTMRIWSDRAGEKPGREEVRKTCQCYAQQVQNKAEKLPYFNKAEMFRCTDEHCVTSACKLGSEKFGTGAKEQEEKQIRQAHASDESAGSRAEQKQIVEFMINMKGQLCAEFVSSRPLASPDMAEVTCIEYRGGSNQVTYIVNMKTGEIERGG